MNRRTMSLLAFSLVALAPAGSAEPEQDPSGMCSDSQNEHTEGLPFPPVERGEGPGGQPSIEIWFPAPRGDEMGGDWSEYYICTVLDEVVRCIEAGFVQKCEEIVQTTVYYCTVQVSGDATAGGESDPDQTYNTCTKFVDSDQPFVTPEGIWEIIDYLT